MSERGERAGVERAAHSLDGRAPSLAPESSSRCFFVIFLLSKVNSDGIFSFIVENMSAKWKTEELQKSKEREFQITFQ